MACHENAEAGRAAPRVRHSALRPAPPAGRHTPGLENENMSRNRSGHGADKSRIDFPVPLTAPRPKPPSDVPGLRAGLASGVEERRTLSGGWSTEAVERVRFRNGTRAIHKIVSDPAHADAEFLVSLIGQAMGAPVPRVAKTVEREIYMELMPGRPAAVVLPDTSSEATEPYARTTGGLLLAMLDAVTANNDRHTGNWLITSEHTVIGIDHAGVDINRGVFDLEGHVRPGQDLSISAFAEYWLVATRHDGDQWKDNRLHIDDVQLLINAVIHLTDQFVSRGYEDWWQAILGRFEAIASHAKGSSRLLAPTEPPRVARLDAPLTPAPSMLAVRPCSSSRSRGNSR